MRSTTAIAIVLLAVTAAPVAGAGDDPLASRLRLRFQNRMLTEAVSPDGRLQRDAGVDRGMLRTYLHRSAAGAPEGDYLAARFDRLYGIERYQISPLRVMLESAEVGASLALFASAVGTTLGGWDEETSWYLVGAAAAAGALWGGAHADEPGWRVRYRWEP